MRIYSEERLISRASKLAPGVQREVNVLRLFAIELMRAGDFASGEIVFVYVELLEGGYTWDSILDDVSACGCFRQRETVLTCVQ